MHKRLFFIHLRNTDVRAAKNGKWESHFLVPDENWEKAGPGLKLKEMRSEEACSCQGRLSTLGLVPSNMSTSKTLWVEIYSFFFVNSFASGAVLTLTTLNHLMNFLMKR